MLDALNVIKSLICPDASKRTTLSDVLMCRLFGGKIKKSREDEIWQKKVNSDDWSVSSKSHVDCRELLDERKSYTFREASEKSFQTELADKSNEQISLTLKAVELEEQLSKRGLARPSEFYKWFRRKLSRIRSHFASCRRKKIPKKEYFYQ